MRRTGLLIAAFLLLAAPAHARGPASAGLTECERGAAAFEAAMHLVPGAARMHMRFTLQARTKRRFRRVEALGFDEWTTAQPGVTRYVYTRRVEELIGPARYRVKVRFVWQDAAGATIARARRRSRACRQPDLRPDLELKDLWLAGSRFAARVRNTGRGAAGPFAVRIGAEEVWLDGLGARRERIVELAATDCEPGTEVVAEADSHDHVDERSERDNTRTLVCL